MKSFIISSSLAFGLCLGCSTLSSRTDYHSSKTNDSQPVCTIWNSDDGAALTSLLGTRVLIKPPAFKRSHFFGPLFIPFIPVHFGKDSLNASIELQFEPEDNGTLRLPISKIEVHFDGRKIDFQNAAYRIQGVQNQEMTSGYLEKAKLEEEITINRPYAITLTGSQQPFPENIDVTFTLYKKNKSEAKTLRFHKEEDTIYKAFILPGSETDALCNTTIPQLGNKRNLL